MKKLLIAIDPGYDQYKIAIESEKNATWFSFPSTIIQVEEVHSGLGKRPDSFYYYPNSGGVYLFGKAAENELTTSRAVERNQELLALNKGMERFQSEYFKFTLEAAIAYSLYLYEKSAEGEEIGFRLTELDAYDLYFGITLPHDSLKKNLPKIADDILCQHNFRFQIGKGMKTPSPFNYDFSEARVTGNSQAICAFLHYGTNDDLTDSDDADENLPCVVYDAGYKTVGRFLLNMNKTIYDAESNTNFAMHNVYRSVADEVNKLLPEKNFEAFRVQEYLKTNRSVNSNRKSVDLKPIYESKLKEICDAACDDLKRKWNTNLEDSRLLLLAGGTGAAYKDEFSRYMKQNYPHIKVALDNKPYYGKTVDPIYAIVVGMIKYMRILEALDDND